MRALYGLLLASGVMAGMLVGTTGSATAAPASPLSVSEPAPGDHPCWTSFVPDNPNGGPLDQYYKNCTDTRHCFAARNLLDGYTWGYTPVDPWQTWHWHWDSTTPGANYTTVQCD